MKEIIHCIPRRDTTENWEKGNPILLKDEIALDTNNGCFKIGDGVTAWKGLISKEEELVKALKYAINFARLDRDCDVDYLYEILHKNNNAYVAYRG